MPRRKLTEPIATLHGKPIVQWDEKPVKMVSIVRGMPIEVYHSDQSTIEAGISSSGLRTIFNESPKHYWATSPYNPKAIDGVETSALSLGRAAHHLLFGQADFDKLFAIRPESLGGERWNGNRTACREWLALQAENGLTVLKGEQADAVQGIWNSLTEEPLVKAGILNGLIEHSWFWKDRETGVWLKIRPDASVVDSLNFADLKLTTSVQYGDLRRTIAKYGYHQQGALVAEACENVLGHKLESYSLVFAENKPPYCISIVTLKDVDLDRGRRANRIAIRKFADGLASGKWLGPAGEVNDARWIELPKWDQDALDERFKMEGA